MSKFHLKISCLALAICMCTLSFGQAKEQPKSIDQKIQSPPPPPPPPVLKDEVYRLVDDMPRFPGCEGQALSKDEMSECLRNKMFEYIADNLEYPKSAKEKGIEGTVVAQFVVNKKGNLEDIKIVRSIKNEIEICSCDYTTADAARDMLKKMQAEVQWTPGKQRGKPVKVLYTIPIKFKL